MTAMIRSQADLEAGPEEHGPAGTTLGPVDVRAWGALVIGVAAGLLVVLCLVITMSLSSVAAA